MSTLTITIGIVAPVITFLIGRYFRSEKIKQLEYSIKRKDQFIAIMRSDINERQNLIENLQQSETEALCFQLNTAIKLEKAIQIVPNINPHHAADKEYIGIYPNNGLEPAHLTREEYQKGVDRLKYNPEDNILTNKN
jgi:hypothetical protein